MGRISNLERSIDEQIERLDVRLFFLEQIVKQIKHQINDMDYDTVERDAYNESVDEYNAMVAEFNEEIADHE